MHRTVMECGRELTYTPEHINGMVLNEIRAQAERQLGGMAILHAVVTVPAYFNDDQRQVLGRSSQLELVSWASHARAGSEVSVRHCNCLHRRWNTAVSEIRQSRKLSQSFSIQPSTAALV